MVKIQSDLIGDYKRYYGNGSIATQMNAKELVLDKINASTDTLGMYMYAIAIGIDIEQFTKLMTQPVIDTIIKLSKSNVINSENQDSNLDGAIREVEAGFLNTLKYSKYFDYKHATGLVNALMLNTSVKFDFADKLSPKIFKGLIQGFEKSDFDNISDYNNFDSLVKAVKPLLAAGTIKNIRIPAVVYTPSEDDQDYGDEDSSGMVNISKQFYRWYKDSMKIPQIDEKSRKIVDIFKTIKEESLAIKVLGQILGINQKIKTAEYDFYKYNTILSNYINKRADEWVEKTPNKVSESKALSVDVDQNKEMLSALYNNGDGFDFMRFISEESYRKEAVNNYQIMTGSKELNILEILSSSDHFMEMISLTYQLSENVFKPNSAKYRTLNNIINHVEKNKIFGQNGNLPKNISEDIHKKLSSYVDDLVVQSFLAQDNGLKISIHKDDPYSYMDSTGKKIESNKRNQTESIDLSTFEGRAKYTSWFENMIRNLQLNKYLRDDNGKLKIESGFNNYFIDNIIPDSDTDFLTKESYYFFKPSININKDMSLEDAAKKAQMIDALKDLKNIKYQGHNMMDLLFMYDLIVNRGKKNQRSFATFIAEAYPMDDFSMISSKYTSYLSDIDASGISLNYDISDFLLRGIAEKKPAKTNDNMIYYESHFNSSLHKMETYYYIGNKAFSIEKQNINKNIPLNGSVKQRTIIDPGIVISLDNSNIKITIKC